MKSDLSEIEQYRTGYSGNAIANEPGQAEGVFLIDSDTGTLQVMASEMHGWDHLSILALEYRPRRRDATFQRNPRLPELSLVKSLFFEETEMPFVYVTVDSPHPAVDLWLPNGAQLVESAEFPDDSEIYTFESNGREIAVSSHVDWRGISIGPDWTEPTYKELQLVRRREFDDSDVVIFPVCQKAILGKVSEEFPVPSGYGFLLNG